MNKIKFEIFEECCEVYDKQHEIKPGVTQEMENKFPELVASFETKEEALQELKKYTSSVRYDHFWLKNYGYLYTVKEYYVQENEYNDDGEWVDGGDIWEFSQMPLEEEEEEE